MFQVKKLKFERKLVQGNKLNTKSLTNLQSTTVINVHHTA